MLALSKLIDENNKNIQIYNNDLIIFLHEKFQEMKKNKLT